jgi:uncharacterized protein YdeI (YjbR/CyaY-like superfamily)
MIFSTTKKIVMAKTDQRIDAYIAKVANFAKPIMNHLRGLIHSACPDVEETWKWSFPHFMYKGEILCSMAAFREHCTFGFWKASLMEDVDKVLEIKDREAMGHLGKITSLKDLPKDAVLKKYVKAAMKLTDDGVKLPPKVKASEKEKKELKTPEDLARELKKNKKAGKVFNDFSYTNKKEYIIWLEEAKTDATREKRLVQAVEWMAEGKVRNWKYLNC